jgi:hypothetical protein
MAHLAQCHPDNEAGAGVSASQEPGGSAPGTEKPKLARNWRGYLKEYAIIVIGVLTALAAQQAAEWWNWRNQVREARQVIATETALNTTGAIARLRTQACIERRLDELGRILDSASRSGSLPPVGYFGTPPRRGWSGGAWDGVLASQVSTHFSRQELARLARLYNTVRLTASYGPNEMETWSLLGTMTGPGRRLDTASEADLRKAISLARSLNRTLANLSFQMLRNMKTLDLPFDQYDKRGMAAARDESLERHEITAANSSPTSLICQPIGAVPPQYGESPLAKAPGITEEGMKLLPDLGK